MYDDDRLEHEVEDERAVIYVKDRLCPRCSARLRYDPDSGEVWCSSLVCSYVEE